MFYKVDKFRILTPEELVKAKKGIRKENGWGFRSTGQLLKDIHGNKVEPGFYIEHVDSMNPNKIFYYFESIGETTITYSNRVTEINFAWLAYENADKNRKVYIDCTADFFKVKEDLVKKRIEALRNGASLLEKRLELTPNRTRKRT